MDDQLKKAIQRTCGAIELTRAMVDDHPDIDLVLGHMTRALEILQGINYELHHDGKKLVQLELFND